MPELMADPAATASDPAIGIAAAGVLAQPTRRRIAELLAQRDAGLGVAEIAVRVDLHPNAVRQHLQKLADAGVVCTERDPPRGRGRPRLRYRLVDMRAPRIAAHQELVRLLIAYIVRSGAATEDVEAFGRLQGGFFATGAGAAGIIESFAGLGFAPREAGSAGDARRGRLRLRLGHCPFMDAVAAPGGEMICRMHRGIVEGIAAGASPGSRLAEFAPADPARAGCGVTVDGLPPREPAGGGAAPEG